MRGWCDIAYLAKTKNLNGGLVARGASGLPVLLYEGLEVALVPPALEVPDLGVAELVVGCRCLVREAEVDLSLIEADDDLHDWEGWRVEDVRAGFVGEVAALDDRAMQPLLVVRRDDGRETLVPLVDAFVEAVDEDARAIRLSCPEGLLDL